VSVTAASARTGADIGADEASQVYKILIASSVPAHYRLGDATVTATTADTFIPEGGEHLVRCVPGQRVAFIRASIAAGDGTSYVSEMAD